MVRGKVIAIDFDGTITEKNDYPRIGAFRENAVECIKKLQKLNHCFLYTCRQGEALREALESLEKKGVHLRVDSPYDYSVASGRKPIADLYIDDLALAVYGEEVDWFKIEKMLLG